MKRFRFLRAAAIICSFSLLLPLATSCSEEAFTESSAPLENGSYSESEEKKTVAVEEKSFEILGVNKSADEKGVYIFTPDYQAVATPKSSKSFFDVAVIGNFAVSVYEKGKNAIIPSDGFILRFCEIDEEIAVGNKVYTELCDIDATPQKYVRFGNKIIEIGHENETRTDEDTGWLYDDRWYSATTTSNVWCTEIAVKDGKIVEINRSGDNIGDTRIPEGGYVIAVGQDSSSERKTNGLKVGDDAELFLGEKLYNVSSFGYSGTNRSRPDDGIVIFTREKQNTTPVGNNLTEVVVDKNNKIIAVYSDCSGINKIPEGGFIISATGGGATTLSKAAKLGALVFQKNARALGVAFTPEMRFSELQKAIESLKARYDETAKAVGYVDFISAFDLIKKAEEAIASVGNEASDGEALAAAIEELQALTKEIELCLIPQITVQDRTAWVTLGEYDYSKNIILHYKTQQDVDHTVAYAKAVGLNTLIIDNLAASFAVYDSEIEGIVKLPQLGDVDLIAAFEKACKEQGIRLIVMVNAFSSGIDGVVYPENHFMSIYKDKYLITNKGRHVGPDGVITLDPADKEIQAFNLAVIAEICEKYDIYGVQADYMRYPLPWFYQEHNYEDFGFNESSTAGFIEKYGKDPAKLKISDPLWEKWCEWKRDIISDYQKRFYETAKAIDSELNVSFTCFADYRDRQIYTCQDVEKWAANGYANAIYPMIYGDNTEYQLGYVEKNLPISEHTDMVIGVGAYVKATHESMQQQLFMNYDVIVEGVSVFTLRYISICGYDSLYRKVFSKEATPTDASDEALIPACKAMMLDRLENIIFVTTDEKIANGISLVASKIKSIDGNCSFTDYKKQLTDIRDEFIASATESASENAVTLLLNYIIGL